MANETGTSKAELLRTLGRPQKKKALTDQERDRDKHGYVTLSAKREKYGDSVTYYWKMRKLAPYSISRPIKEVAELIRHDLIEFYDFCPDSDLSANDPVSDVEEAKKQVRTSFGLTSVKANEEAKAYEIEYWAFEPI